MILSIINRIENGKKLTKRILENDKLPKKLRDKLERYNLGSKRLDISKLVRDLKQFKVGGEPICKGNDSILGKGTFGSVFSCSDTIAIKIFKDKNIAYNINNFYCKYQNDPNIFNHTTFINIKDYKRWEEEINYDKPKPITTGFRLKLNFNFCENVRYFGEKDNNYYYPVLKCDKSFANYNLEDKNINTIHNDIMQLLIKLDWLTSKNIIHGDIKQDNILIKSDQIYLHDFDYYNYYDKYTNLIYTHFYISPIYYLELHKISNIKFFNTPKENYLEFYFKSQILKSKQIRSDNDYISKCVLFLNTGNDFVKLNVDKYCLLRKELLETFLNEDFLKKNIENLKLLDSLINNYDLLLKNDNDIQKIKNINKQIYDVINKLNITPKIENIESAVIYLSKIYIYLQDILGINDINNINENLYANIVSYNTFENKLKTIKLSIVDNNFSELCFLKNDDEFKKFKNFPNFIHIFNLLITNREITDENIRFFKEYLTDLNITHYKFENIRKTVIDIQKYYNKNICETQKFIYGNNLNYLTLQYYSHINYDQILKLLIDNKETNNYYKKLYYLNIIKNDYYSLGFIIFQIYYNLVIKINKLKKSKSSNAQNEINVIQSYIDNVLIYILSLCFIPFYFNLNDEIVEKLNEKTFKHGYMISHFVKRFCIENNYDNNLPWIKNFAENTSIPEKFDDIYDMLYNNIFNSSLQQGKGQKGSGKKMPPPKINDLKKLIQIKAEDDLKYNPLQSIKIDPTQVQGGKK